MTRRCLLLALVGCNQIYELDPTTHRDATGPDAPYRCTDAAPDLRGKPVLIADGRDAPRSYSISIDRRIAVGLRSGTLFEGPADAPLMTGALLSPAPALVPGSPRLAPEGDELFVRYYDPIATTPPSHIDRYKREGELWVRMATILTLNAIAPDLSAPTRLGAGPRRMLVLFSVTDMREFVETTLDQWMQVGVPYTPAELGTAQITFPNLTPDGLHLILEGRDASNLPMLVYASRASVEARFANPVSANPFFGSPQITDPFLVEDCARMYFFVPSKPGGLYYVEP
ncbi:MAG: hypothetical protein H6Q90_6862 [Deltaproteobacteria bacterium]|nr:hypothetical protein [Deltaproteobacteria bacterium]